MHQRFTTAIRVFVKVLCIFSSRGHILIHLVVEFFKPLELFLEGGLLQTTTSDLLSFTAAAKARKLPRMFSGSIRFSI